MTRDEIVDLFDRRMNAFNDHDVESFAETYTEDAVVESPLGGTHQGRAAITAVAAAFLSALSDATFSQDALIIDGDQVVEVVTMSGTDNGGFMGMDSSGLGALVASSVTAKNNAGQIKLVSLTKRLQDLLAIAKLLTVFDAYDSEAEAINSFAAQTTA